MNLALDLDGTLITCEPRQSAVLRAALRASGQRGDTGRVWELKRQGASTEQALLATGLEPGLARRVAQDWRRSVEDPAWLGLDTVHPGVREVLRDMRAEGLRLCLVTARSRPEWVLQQLARLGLSPCLDQLVIVPANDPSRAKSLVLRELAAIGFIGDTESDWHASRDAGVRFHAVATGQRSAEYLAGKGVGSPHGDLATAWASFRADIPGSQVDGQFQGPGDQVGGQEPQLFP